MPKRHSILLLVIPLLAGAMTAGAQSLYKWVDQNGRITYSDQPPPNTNVKSQEQVRAVQPVNGSAVSEMAKQDTAFKKRQEDAAKKAADQEKKDKAEATKVENCSRARGDLRAIRNNAPIARVMENGEHVLLDPSMRDTEGRRIENYIEENCSNAG